MHARASLIHFKKAGLVKADRAIIAESGNGLFENDEKRIEQQQAKPSD